MTSSAIASGSELQMCARITGSTISNTASSAALDATRRKEMFARLDQTLGHNEGKILMLQVCEKDVAPKREIVRIIALE